MKHFTYYEVYVLAAFSSNISIVRRGLEANKVARISALPPSLFKA